MHPSYVPAPHRRAPERRVGKRGVGRASIPENIQSEGGCLRKLQRDPKAKDVTKVSISGEQRNGVAESVGRNQQIH